MKIPNNISQEETINTITLVVDRIAPKYTFPNFDVDDIKQEAFIICIEALERYDNKRSLENFLSANLSNRLKNFVRDKYGHAKDIERKKVSSPASLSDVMANTHSYEEFNDVDIDNKDFMQRVEDKLPASLRESYLKFINGVKISKTKKIKLLTFIKDVLNEEG